MVCQDGAKTGERGGGGGGGCTIDCIYLIIQHLLENGLLVAVLLAVLAVQLVASLHPSPNALSPCGPVVWRSCKKSSRCREPSAANI